MTTFERARNAVFKFRLGGLELAGNPSPELRAALPAIDEADEIARAVLRAIRYAPDDDFFALAGAELPPEFQSRGDKGVIACTIWQAMIDAALGEG